MAFCCTEHEDLTIITYKLCPMSGIDAGTAEITFVNAHDDDGDSSCWCCWCLDVIATMRSKAVCGHLSVYTKMVDIRKCSIIVCVVSLSMMPQPHCQISVSLSRVNSRFRPAVLLLQQCLIE